MTEEQLRALIREEIARALGGASSSRPATEPSRTGYGPSHLILSLVPAGDGSACVIEPAVACTGCGYCKSLGH